MKKIGVLLYFVFILFVNVLLFGYGDTISSFFDLLFLNSEQFFKYQLEIFNFQYIISFFLLFLFILYGLLSDRNEATSYLYMIVYRKGTMKTLKDMQMKAMKQIVTIIIMLNITILCACFIKNGVLFIDDKQLISMVLYMLKVALLFMISVEIFNVLSIFGKSNRGMILPVTYFVFCILSDVLIHTDFITYTSNINSECLFLGINILFYMLVWYIAKMRIKRKGELL